MTSGNLRDYFREALGQAMGESMVRLTQHCQLYLINLLSEFSRSENVYAGTDYGETPTLAVLMSRAAQAEPQKPFVFTNTSETVPSTYQDISMNLLKIKQLV